MDRAVGVAPAPVCCRGRWSVGGSCFRNGIIVGSIHSFIPKRKAAYEVANNDTALACVAVLEANDDHAVAAETAAPAVHAVFFADATQHQQFVVAVHADVVVAFVAFETVVAGVDGRDRVFAYVAFRGEG